MADEQTVNQDHEERDADEGEGSGADSGEDKAQQRASDEPAATDSVDEQQSKESAKAQEKEEERQKAKEKMKEFEEGDPPENLEDWPDDAAKYETYGGPDGGRSYEEGPEVKLGPSSLRHHEDGTVTIAGEEVDNPDDYKGEPIPGGPTDENAADDLTAKKIKQDQKGDGGSDDSDSEDDDKES
jgi:hypothetical protein